MPRLQTIAIRSTQPQPGAPAGRPRGNSLADDLNCEAAGEELPHPIVSHPMALLGIRMASDAEENE